MPYRATWELGSLKGTSWEHIENKEDKQKKTPPHPTPERKKQGPSWLHEISISKIVAHHFWPGLIAGAEIWGHNQLHIASPIH